MDQIIILKRQQHTKKNTTTCCARTQSLASHKVAERARALDSHLSKRCVCVCLFGIYICLFTCAHLLYMYKLRVISLSNLYTIHVILCVYICVLCVGHIEVNLCICLKDCRRYIARLALGALMWLLANWKDVISFWCNIYIYKYISSHVAPSNGETYEKVYINF